MRAGAGGPAGRHDRDKTGGARVAAIRDRVGARPGVQKGMKLEQ